MPADPTDGVGRERVLSSTGDVGVEPVEAVLDEQDVAAGERGPTQRRRVLGAAAPGHPRGQAQRGTSGDATPLVRTGVDADVDTLALQHVDRALEGDEVEPPV